MKTPWKWLVEPLLIQCLEALTDILNGLTDLIEGKKRG